MVIGKMRRACKRGLSIALAAAVMATSAPQLSVTAMAQEQGMIVQQEITDQTPVEVTEPTDTEGEDSSDEDSAQDKPADENEKDQDGENEAGEDQEDPDKAEDDVVNPDQEEDPEAKDDADGADDGEASDVKPNEEDADENDEEGAEPEEKPVEVEGKVYYASAQSEDETIEGKTIFEENFDSQTVGTEISGDKGTGVIAQLANGNMAVEYDVDLSATNDWTDIFQAGVNVSPVYSTPIAEKMTLSYDVYFPHTTEDGGVSDIGTMKAKAILKVGDDWTWTEGAEKLYEFTSADLVQDAVADYSKLHIVMDLSEETGWNVEEITSIPAIIPCLAGDTSTYKGKLYLDNIVLRDTSTLSGEDKPDSKDVVVYKSDFNELTADTELAKGTVRQLADGNMAIEYSADLSASEGWTSMFQADSLSLDTPYDASKAGKMNLSYDVYFEESAGGIGTVKAQAILRNTGDWNWNQATALPVYTDADLTSGEIADYQKLHISVDIEEGSDWTLADITDLRAFTPCLAGDTSHYKGKMYLDNVVLTATPASSGEEKPGSTENLIYENNFDEETDASFVKAESGEATPALAELTTGNKAIKYTVDLTDSTGWVTIFKAQINLPQAYTEPISDKVVMSYDVYFPTESVTESFQTIKAQAALKVGADWTWVDQKSWPAITADMLTDSDIDGYKKFHVEINMNDFQTWDGSGNVDYPFANITPIQTVIPCLGGDTSGYAGDVYLDNLVVKAVNESGSDLPDVEGDLVLDLDASAWEVTDGWDYSGTSTVRNETVGGKKYLVTGVDYSANKATGWSEAKFNYTHPQSVSTLKGYNAFKADVYYKPTDMTQGGFAMKIFSDSPAIDKNADVPEGQPVTIEGLEGYYKAEYTGSLKIRDGAFTGLTLGMVGKNTDYQGDIYFDNMRFTQVKEDDIYVDSTILPKKGPGIKVTDGGRKIETASGQKVDITREAALVDGNATEATKNLYAYLKAVGESDSVIFGHQNDTHHKAGTAGEGFSTSDTEDVTGSIAGVVGIDTLSLTGNEASSWDTPEAERIANVADITRKAAEKGALITLSAHMPNFDLIDQRVKAYEASGETLTGNEKIGYWKAEDGSRQYNFSGYTPGTLTGNVVTRIMPGQDLNYLYTDYLDLVADYAKAVEKDGITILFRPFHDNTGSWFWWGAALCDEEAYINLYRYTVDYLKETKGVHNILYVYGPGSEAANAAEYGARYPGDAYVDMIGYDMYHSNPSQENEAAFLSNIKSQNAILREFATAHDKLYAITETGVADGSVALKRSGNQVKDWYMQLLDALDGEGVSYFLVWANFDEDGSFYLPYVKDKKADGILHGHEMLDEFITFYNDERSVFATDMNSEFKNITGVTNTTEGKAVVSGYIVSPQSGDRILPSAQGTRITAKIAGLDATADVRYVVTTDYDSEVLTASYNEEEGVWEAVLEDSALVSLGKGIGTIALMAGDKEVSVIKAKFNMEEVPQDDMIPEDFEGYNGNDQQLALAWATNKDTGSEIALSLTDDKEKVFGGDYGLQMDVTLLNGNAWAGATKSFAADWSAGNALEFYTIPERNGQKVVVQVTSGGVVWEVYLQEFEAYTANAASEIPVKVTIPFSAFVDRDGKGASFDPSTIESIGLWCNAIAKEGVNFPLRTTLYYDEIKVVQAAQPGVSIEGTAKEGIWFKAIPNQTYTGAAIKPDVEVYDSAKLLKKNKDYTVTYRNNVKVGSEAKVIIHGKGNYKQKLEGYFVIEPKELAAGMAQGPEYMICNDSEQNIKVVVRDGKKTLSSRNDYTQVITYKGQTVEKAKEAGVYDIKITGKNNYKGEIMLSCELVEGKTLLSDATVQLKSASLDYKNGEPVTYQDSQIVVKLNRKVVPQTEGDIINYTISYENNTEPGTAAVVIRAGENSPYIGSCRKEFTVKGMTFSAKTMTMSGFVNKMNYTGKPVFQNIVLTDKASKETLKKNVHYSIIYENHVNSGKATMVITGLGKYSGTIKKTYTISKVKLTADMIGSKKIEVKQNRAGATPDVTVIYQGSKLVKDRDYTLTYTNNKNVTTDTKKAYISINGIGNFTGKLNKAVELKINPKSWLSSDITVEVPDMKYYSFRSKYMPAPVVRDNGRTLVKGQDYTVTYESNTKADIGDITLKPDGHTAKAIVTVNGSDYVPGADGTDHIVVEFRVAARMIKDAKVTVKNPQYFSQSGTWPKEEELEVRYKGELVDPSEYEIISRDSNTGRGRRTLVIQGKGQYGGTKKVTYLVQAKGIYDNWTQEAVQMLSNVVEIFQ